MVAKSTAPLFQVGDRVAIRYSDWRGRIVEFRGPLAPGGVFVYRVRVPLKPKPKYIELREDQLAMLSAPPNEEPKSFEKHLPEGPEQQGAGPALPRATNKSPRFQIGDRVKIHHSDWRGRIVEFRGPLTPGGRLVYCIRIPHKPKPFFIEVPEDEVTSIRKPMKDQPRSSARQQARDEPEQK